MALPSRRALVILGGPMEWVSQLRSIKNITCIWILNELVAVNLANRGRSMEGTVLAGKKVLLFKRIRDTKQNA